MKDALLVVIVLGALVLALRRRSRGGGRMDAGAPAIRG